jgi:hypothetical protein
MTFGLEEFERRAGVDEQHHQLPQLHDAVAKPEPRVRRPAARWGEVTGPPEAGSDVSRVTRAVGPRVALLHMVLACAPAEVAP